jgi:hypothetical protein
LGPELERLDATLRLPLPQAALEVGDNARGGLVALLGRLGEQLQDDGGDCGGDRQPLTGRHRLSGDMAVNPLHGIGSRERQSAGEHLVERDAEGIEVATGVDRPGR